jgi:NADH:ubiquinone oxidoreductase subunit D
MNEMAESLNIINQLVYKITKFSKRDPRHKISKILSPHLFLKYVYSNKYNLNNFKNNYISMENLINHFKY